MELWLAVFGLAAAVLMIWLSRNRHRDNRGASGEVGGGTSGGVEHKTGIGGGNGHGTDGDGGSGGDGGGGD